jgi:hypothetical protein
MVSWNVRLLWSRDLWELESRMMLTRTSNNLLNLTVRCAVWQKVILYQTAWYHR